MAICGSIRLINSWYANIKAESFLIATHALSTIAVCNILLLRTVISPVLSVSPDEFVVGTKPIYEQSLSKFLNRLISPISVIRGRTRFMFFHNRNAVELIDEGNKSEFFRYNMIIAVKLVIHAILVNIS